MIGSLDGTLVVIITDGEVGVTAVGTLAESEVVVLDDTVAGGFLDPVRIGGGGTLHLSGAFQVLGDVHLVQLGAVEVVVPVEGIAEAVLVRVHLVVHGCAPEGFTEFLGVHDIELVDVGGDCDGGVEGDAHLAALSFLSGDDDHTVGSAGTVDGRGGGVLQELDALDVIGVHRADTGCRDTVHNVQRGSPVHGADTTDLDGSRRVRRTAGGDAYAGDLALEGLHRVTDVHFLGGAHVDDGHGTGEVGLLFSGITGNDDLVKQLAVLFENNIHLRGGPEDFGDISHGGELQGASGRNSEGELAILIGYGSDGRPNLNDSRSDEGFSFRGINRSPDSHVLRECGEGEQKHQKCQCG